MPPGRSSVRGHRAVRRRRLSQNYPQCGPFGRAYADGNPDICRVPPAGRLAGRRRVDVQEERHSSGRHVCWRCCREQWRRAARAAGAASLVARSLAIQFKTSDRRHPILRPWNPCRFGKRPNPAMMEHNHRCRRVKRATSRAVRIWSHAGSGSLTHLEIDTSIFPIASGVRCRGSCMPEFTAHLLNELFCDNVSPTRIISRRSNKVAAGFGDCLAETRQQAYREILFGSGSVKDRRVNLKRPRLSSNIAYLCKRFSHPHMCWRYIGTQETVLCSFSLAEFANRCVSVLISR
jgi:hypothetical protein